MTPRERVVAAFTHQEPDEFPLDVNSVLNRGVRVSTLHKQYSIKPSLWDTGGGRGGNKK